jgi:hypothetical protein
MIEQLQKICWLIAVRGVFGNIVGIAALISPLGVVFSLLFFSSFYTRIFVIILAFLGELSNKWLRVVRTYFHSPGCFIFRPHGIELICS